MVSLCIEVVRTVEWSVDASTFMDFTNYSDVRGFRSVRFILRLRCYVTLCCIGGYQLQVCTLQTEQCVL